MHVYMHMRVCMHACLSVCLSVCLSFLGCNGGLSLSFQHACPFGHTLLGGVKLTKFKERLPIMRLSTVRVLMVVVILLVEGVDRARCRSSRSHLFKLVLAQDFLTLGRLVWGRSLSRTPLMPSGCRGALVVCQRLSIAIRMFERSSQRRWTWLR